MRNVALLQSEELLVPVEHVRVGGVLELEVEEVRQETRLPGSEGASVHDPVPLRVLHEAFRAHKPVPEQRLPVLDRDAQHHAVRVEGMQDEVLAVLELRGNVLEEGSLDVLGQKALQLFHELLLAARVASLPGLLVEPLSQRSPLRGHRGDRLTVTSISWGSSYS